MDYLIHCRHRSPTISVRWYTVEGEYGTKVVQVEFNEMTLPDGECTSDGVDTTDSISSAINGVAGDISDATSITPEKQLHRVPMSQRDKLVFDEFLELK